MADKKLESFKIADTRRPGVSNTGRKAEAPKAEVKSVGFKRIETILENEDQPAVEARLTKIAEGLGEYAEQAKGNKGKAAAKKAVAAVERTRELMNHLYQTKTAMTNPQAK
jgi:hypothetical protein